MNNGLVETRALPYEDLAALHSVVAVLDGHLVGGDLPPDLTRHLIRRLTDRGPLPAGATAGTLNAALTDLAQRLHWAIGHDMEYPAAMPHRTTYQLVVPAGSVAACLAALREMGAGDIHDGPPVPEGRSITVSFPELAPDPAYRRRTVQLSALAERHGGRYDGASW